MSDYALSADDTRFFYTDSLAAAWMAKHFGMQFVGRSSNLSDLSDFFVEFHTGAVVQCHCDYVIHPDSLHLLEPQSSDLVTYKLGVVGCVGRPHDDGPIGVWWAGSGGQDPLNGEEQVIQRDGKPFFWPEREELA